MVPLCAGVRSRQGRAELVQGLRRKGRRRRLVHVVQLALVLHFQQQLFEQRADRVERRRRLVRRSGRHGGMGGRGELARGGCRGSVVVRQLEQRRRRGWWRGRRRQQQRRWQRRRLVIPPNGH